ncbi:MAG: PP2C family serine/threonine-protein phosphatase [Rubrivivax sp.]
MHRASLLTPLEPGSRPLDAATVHARGTLYATPFLRLEAAVASACGSQHARNEDAHSDMPGSGKLFVVADGVGGGAMAQLASRHLVNELHAALDPQPRIDAEAVRRAMLAADRAIARRIAEVTASPGAATVALCAPLDAAGSQWLVAWVGDCRVYRIGPGANAPVELLTRDDTFRHRNEMPPAGGSLDDPARMVGNGAVSGTNVALHELGVGALLVLCSDGVHKCVGDAAWRALARKPQPLDRGCGALVELARANGSHDDATVLALRRLPLGPADTAFPPSR